MTPVVPLVTALALCAAPRLGTRGYQPTGAERAYRLALRGDLAEARAAAERALAADPRDRMALLVEACVAIEGGDLGSAAAPVERLERAGSRSRAKVLRRLLERRRTRPAERIRDALAAAWKEGGRPDLDDDGPFRWWEEPLLPPLDAAALAKLSPAERAAVAPGGLDVAGEVFEGAELERAKPVLAAAGDASANPLWVNLILLSRLPERAIEPRELAGSIADVRLRLASAAAAAAPQNGYPRMIAVLAAAPPGAPLSPADLDALEAAASAPRFEPPRSEILAQARARLREVDAVHGDLRAVLLSRTQLPTYASVLLERAEATVEPASRARAGRLLSAIGRRLRSNPALVDPGALARVEEGGARLSGNAKALADARAWAEESRRWRERVDATLRRLGGWPLVSAVREADPEGEAAYLQRLLE